MSKKASGEKRELDTNTAKKLHSIMVRTRILEERLIKMSKSGEGYFWIGGPGEEAFGCTLGMLGRVGHGLDNDFWHFHYRAGPTLVAMGADPIDSIRQMRATETDPYSRGRNFVNHFAVPKWNVVPVSSCIEPQYSQAIGTAHAQARKKAKGITIVTGGDAGTAEGDFATALVWSSRPADILPLLIIVTNNSFGISTPAQGMHGEKHVSDRGKAFGIKSKTINGNDVYECWREIGEAIDYVRTERKPFLLEAVVSRLHGHSSASGANRVNDEPDCIADFEESLVKKKILTKKAIEDIWIETRDAINNDLKQVRQEAFPTPESIYDHVYADENGDNGADYFARDIGVDYTKDPVT